MSWFKRSPQPKAPPHREPKRTSPIADRKLEESKKTGPAKKK